jgi:hypothetical protein
MGPGLQNLAGAKCHIGQDFGKLAGANSGANLPKILLFSEPTHGMLTGQIRTKVPGNHQNQQRFILLRSNCEQLRSNRTEFIKLAGVNPDFGKLAEANSGANFAHFTLFSN